MERIPLKNPTNKRRIESKFQASTVLRRIVIYCKSQKKPPFVTIEDKQAIGTRVKEAFFNNPYKKNKGAFKIEVKEPQGVFRVLVYPAYFVATIDSIIRTYFRTMRR